MNWKEWIKNWWFIILLGMTLFILFGYFWLFPSPTPNLNGATWECESCQNPNLVGQKCDYPGFAAVEDGYNCLITCADNSTIQTECLKARLVKYSEVEK